MSGIIGCVQHDGTPLDRAAVQRMTSVLAQRGPDRCRHWCGEGAALGHALLATTPEAWGDHQPLHGPNDRYVLTADARVDNRNDLLRTLRRHPFIHGRKETDVPDSVLILAGYERWGERVVDHLVGDYALAIWDARERRLFCARDPMGVRPLYYHTGPGCFLFASSIPALLAHGDVPRQPDDAHVSAFLRGRPAAGGALDGTFYAAVRRLPPAHALSVTARGRVDVRRHWKPEETVSLLHLPSDAAYEAGFRDAFDAAVQSCLRVTGPVGIALSGGLDSSAVATVAREAGRENPAAAPVHTFTGVFRDVFTAQHAPSANARAVDPRVDEWAFAQSVLSDGGFSSHVVRADQMSFLHGMETLVQAYGQPFHPRSHYLATGIAESVREAGIRVLMDGSEGDVVVGYGLDYFDGLAAEGDWATFAQVAEAYAGNCRSGGRRYLPESAFWAHGLDALRDHLLNGRWGRFLRELAAVRRTLGISAPRLVHRALRSALAARSSAEAGRNGAPEHTANPVYRRAMALVRNPMLAETLDAADALYAAHGLEARHPFFDRRVVEYCLSLPAEQRMKGGWTRSILRRALRDVLPNEIQTRVGKSDLGRAVVRHVCPRDLETITRLAAAGSLRPYASSREVQRAVHRFTEAPSVSHLKPLVHLAVLSTWLNGTTEDFTGLCASSHASLHGKC